MTTVEALIDVSERLNLWPPDPEPLLKEGALLLAQARLEAYSADDPAALVLANRAGLLFVDVALRYAAPITHWPPDPGQDGGLHLMRGRMLAELAANLPSPSQPIH